MAFLRPAAASLRH